MKQLILCLAILSAATVSGQKTTVIERVQQSPTSIVDTTIIIQVDTVVTNVQKKRVVIVDAGENIVLSEGEEMIIEEEVCYKKKRSMDWGMMFDFGWCAYDSRNAFTGAKGDEFIDLDKSKSTQFAWYPCIGELPLGKNKLFSLLAGIGVDWCNYRFENGWTIDKVDGQTVRSPKYRENGESLVSKSKLMTAYMNVPLLLRMSIPLNSNSKHTLNLSAGAIGSVLIGSHTKAKYSDSGNKVKDHDWFYLNMLRYQLTFRAGIDSFDMFLNYQMTPMFENGKGPKLYPYSIGVSFKI